MAFVGDTASQHAKRRPFGPALTFSGQTISWKELGAAVLKREACVCDLPERSRIALCSRDPARLLIDFLAVAHAGHVAMIYDPDWPQERRRHIEDITSPARILMPHTLSGDFGSGSNQRRAASRPTADASFYIGFTSGSTGVPKGFERSHQSWLKSFENVATSIARAGNVIGGGDICEDRLIPDLITSFINQSTPQLRYPNAVRPWQHVLDCLNGYLLLIEQMVNSRETGAWNFGPKDSKSKTVAEVTERSGAIWGTDATWTQTPGNHPKESVNLLLDSSKARERLGWVDKLSFEESLEWTINWYRNVNQGKNPREETDENIRRFEGK